MSVFFSLVAMSGHYGRLLTISRFIRWRVTLMERTIGLLELGSAKTPIPDNGPDPYKAFQIHDYLQISFMRHHPAVKAASKKAIDLFQNYYPECLDKKFLVNVPIIMGWMFNAMKMIVNKDTFKKLFMLTYGASLASELKSETVPEEYGGKGVKLSTKGMTIDLDGQLIKLEPKGVESGDVDAVVTTEAPKEELVQVKEGAESSRAPEESKAPEGSGMVEEPQAVEKPEDTEQQSETARADQTNETGEASEPATVAAPTTATTPAVPTTPTSSPTAPASPIAEPLVDKSAPVEPETDVPPPVPAKNSGEQPQK